MIGMRRYQMLKINMMNVINMVNAPQLLLLITYGVPL